MKPDTKDDMWYDPMISLEKAKLQEQKADQWLFSAKGENRNSLQTGMREHYGLMKVF